MSGRGQDQTDEIDSNGTPPRNTKSTAASVSLTETSNPQSNEGIATQTSDVIPPKKGRSRCSSRVRGNASRNELIDAEPQSNEGIATQTSTVSPPKKGRSRSRSRVRGNASRNELIDAEPQSNEGIATQTSTVSPPKKGRSRSRSRVRGYSCKNEMIDAEPLSNESIATQTSTVSPPKKGRSRSRSCIKGNASKNELIDAEPLSNESIATQTSTVSPPKKGRSRSRSCIKGNASKNELIDAEPQSNEGIATQTSDVIPPKKGRSRSRSRVRGNASRNELIDAEPKPNQTKTSTTKINKKNIEKSPQKKDQSKSSSRGQAENHAEDVATETKAKRSRSRSRQTADTNGEQGETKPHITRSPPRKTYVHSKRKGYMSPTLNSRGKPILLESEIRAIATCAAKVAAQLPQFEVRPLNMKKDVNKQIMEILRPKNKQDITIEVMRKYGIIYRRFDAQKTYTRPINRYEMYINEATAQLCYHRPNLLTRREDVFPLARCVVKESGYTYTHENERRNISSYSLNTGQRQEFLESLLGLCYSPNESTKRETQQSRSPLQDNDAFESLNQTVRSIKTSPRCADRVTKQLKRVSQSQHKGSNVEVSEPSEKYTLPGIIRRCRTRSMDRVFEIDEMCSQPEESSGYMSDHGSSLYKCGRSEIKEKKRRRSRSLDRLSRNRESASDYSDRISSATTMDNQKINKYMPKSLLKVSPAKQLALNTTSACCIKETENEGTRYTDNSVVVLDCQSDMDRNSESTATTVSHTNRQTSPTARAVSHTNRRGAQSAKAVSSTLSTKRQVKPTKVIHNKTTHIENANSSATVSGRYPDYTGEEADQSDSSVESVGEELECDFCPQAFKSYSDLEDHWLQHFSSLPKLHAYMNRQRSANNFDRQTSSCSVQSTSVISPTKRKKGKKRVVSFDMSPDKDSDLGNIEKERTNDSDSEESEIIRNDKENIDGRSDRDGERSEMGTSGFDSEDNDMEKSDTDNVETEKMSDIDQEKSEMERSETCCEGETRTTYKENDMSTCETNNVETDRVDNSDTSTQVVTVRDDSQTSNTELYSKTGEMHKDDVIEITESECYIERTHTVSSPATSDIAVEINDNSEPESVLISEQEQPDRECYSESQTETEKNSSDAETVTDYDQDIDTPDGPLNGSKLTWNKNKSARVNDTSLPSQVEMCKRKTLKICMKKLLPDDYRAYWREKYGYSSSDSAHSTPDLRLILKAKDMSDTQNTSHIQHSSDLSTNNIGLTLEQCQTNVVYIQEGIDKTNGSSGLNTESCDLIQDKTESDTALDDCVKESSKDLLNHNHHICESPNQSEKPIVKRIYRSAKAKQVKKLAEQEKKSAEQRSKQRVLSNDLDMSLHGIDLDSESGYECLENDTHHERDKVKDNEQNINTNIEMKTSVENTLLKDRKVPNGDSDFVVRRSQRKRKRNKEKNVSKESNKKANIEDLLSIEAMCDTVDGEVLEGRGQDISDSINVKAVTSMATVSKHTFSEINSKNLVIKHSVVENKTANTADTNNLTSQETTKVTNLSLSSPSVLIETNKLYARNDKNQTETNPQPMNELLKKHKVVLAALQSKQSVSSPNFDKKVESLCNIVNGKRSSQRKTVKPKRYENVDEDFETSFRSQNDLIEEVREVKDNSETDTNGATAISEGAVPNKESVRSGSLHDTSFLNDRDTSTDIYDSDHQESQINIDTAKVRRGRKNKQSKKKEMLNRTGESDTTLDTSNMPVRRKKRNKKLKAEKKNTSGSALKEHSLTDFTAESGMLMRESEDPFLVHEEESLVELNTDEDMDRSALNALLGQDFDIVESNSCNGRETPYTITEDSLINASFSPKRDNILQQEDLPIFECLELLTKGDPNLNDGRVVGRSGDKAESIGISEGYAVSDSLHSLDSLKSLTASPIARSREKSTQLLLLDDKPSSPLTSVIKQGESYIEKVDSPRLKLFNDSDVPVLALPANYPSADLFKEALNSTETDTICYMSTNESVSSNPQEERTSCRKIHRCEVCNMRFKSMELLQSHAAQQKHNTTRSEPDQPSESECQVCKAIFLSEQELTVHRGNCRKPSPNKSVDIIDATIQPTQSSDINCNTSILDLNDVKASRKNTSVLVAAKFVSLLSPQKKQGKGLTVPSPMKLNETISVAQSTQNMSSSACGKKKTIMTSDSSHKGSKKINDGVQSPVSNQSTTTVYGTGTKENYAVGNEIKVDNTVDNVTKGGNAVDNVTKGDNTAANVTKADSIVTNIRKGDNAVSSSTCKHENLVHIDDNVDEVDIAHEMKDKQGEPVVRDEDKVQCELCGKRLKASKRNKHKCKVSKLNTSGSLTNSMNDLIEERYISMNQTKPNLKIKIRANRIVTEPVDVSETFTDIEAKGASECQTSSEADLTDYDANKNRTSQIPKGKFKIFKGESEMKIILKKVQFKSFKLNGLRLQFCGSPVSPRWKLKSPKDHADKYSHMIDKILEEGRNASLSETSENVGHQSDSDTRESHGHIHCDKISDSGRGKDRNQEQYKTRHKNHKDSKNKDSRKMSSSKQQLTEFEKAILSNAKDVSKTKVKKSKQNSGEKSLSRQNSVEPSHPSDTLQESNRELMHKKKSRTRDTDNTAHPFQNSKTAQRIFLEAKRKAAHQDGDPDFPDISETKSNVDALQPFREMLESKRDEVKKNSSSKSVTSELSARSLKSDLESIGIVANKPNPKLKDLMGSVPFNMSFGMLKSPLKRSWVGDTDLPTTKIPKMSSKPDAGLASNTLWPSFKQGQMMFKSPLDSCYTDLNIPQWDKGDFDYSTNNNLNKTFPMGPQSFNGLTDCTFRPVKLPNEKGDNKCDSDKFTVSYISSNDERTSVKSKSVLKTSGKNDKLDSDKVTVAQINSSDERTSVKSKSVFKTSGKNDKLDSDKVTVAQINSSDERTSVKSKSVFKTSGKNKLSNRFTSTPNTDKPLKTKIRIRRLEIPGETQSSTSSQTSTVLPSSNSVKQGSSSETDINWPSCDNQDSDEPLFIATPLRTVKIKNRLSDSIDTTKNLLNENRGFETYDNDELAMCDTQTDLDYDESFLETKSRHPSEISEPDSYDRLLVARSISVDRSIADVAALDSEMKNDRVCEPVDDQPPQNMYGYQSTPVCDQFQTSNTDDSQHLKETTCISRDESNKVLSAYDNHRHLEPYYTQPKKLRTNFVKVSEDFTNTGSPCFSEEPSDEVEDHAYESEGTDKDASDHELDNDTMGPSTNTFSRNDSVYGNSSQMPRTWTYGDKTEERLQSNSAAASVGDNGFDLDKYEYANKDSNDDNDIGEEADDDEGDNTYKLNENDGIEADDKKDKCVKDEDLSGKESNKEADEDDYNWRSVKGEIEVTECTAEGLTKDGSPAVLKTDDDDDELALDYEDDDVLDLFAPDDASFLDSESVLEEPIAKKDVDRNGGSPDSEARGCSPDQMDLESQSSPNHVDSKREEDVGDRVPEGQGSQPGGSQRVLWIPPRYCHKFCNNQPCKQNCRFRHVFPDKETVLKSLPLVMDACKSGKMETALWMLSSHDILAQRLPPADVMSLFRLALMIKHITGAHALLKLMYNRQLNVQNSIDDFIYQFSTDASCGNYLLDIFKMAKFLNIQPKQSSNNMLLKVFTESQAWEPLWEVLLYLTECDSYKVPLNYIHAALKATVDNPSFLLQQTVQWLCEADQDLLRDLNPYLVQRLCVVLRRDNQVKIADTLDQLSRSWDSRPSLLGPYRQSAPLMSIPRNVDPPDTGRHRSVTPPAMGRHRSGTPPSMGQHRSSTPPAMGRHRSVTPPAMGQHRSGTPPVIGRHRSGTPPAMGRHRSGTPPAQHGRLMYMSGQEDQGDYDLLVQNIQSVQYMQSWDYLGDLFVDVLNKQSPPDAALLRQFMLTLSKNPDVIALGFKQFLFRVKTLLEKDKQMNPRSFKDLSSLSSIGLELVFLCHEKGLWKQGRDLLAFQLKQGILCLKPASMVVSALQICVNAGDSILAQELLQTVDIGHVPAEVQKYMLDICPNLIQLLLKCGNLSRCYKLLTTFFNITLSDNFGPLLGQNTSSLNNVAECLLQRCAETNQWQVAISIYKLYCDHSLPFNVHSSLKRYLIVITMTKGYKDFGYSLYEDLKKNDMYCVQSLKCPRVIMLNKCLTRPEVYLIVRDYLFSLYNGFCDMIMENQILNKRDLELGILIDYSGSQQRDRFLIQLGEKDISSDIVQDILQRHFEPPLQITFNNQDNRIYILQQSLEHYLQALDNSGRKQGLVFQPYPQDRINTRRQTSNRARPGRIRGRGRINQYR